MLRPVRHTRATAACALLVAALAGCGADAETGDDEDGGAGAAALEVDDGTVVLVAEPSDGGMEALAVARLEVVGTCLGIYGSVVIWPAGTEVVDEDPLTIDLPGVGEVALGERFEMGGGFVFEHSSDGEPPDPFEVGGVTVPPACAEFDVWVANTA